MIAQASLSARILAVLAALCLVGAFALVTLLPSYLSLAQLVARMDHQLLVRSQDWSAAHLPDWFWRGLVLPLLVRPSWLLPLALGLVLGGLALTMASRTPTATPRRRRG